MTVLAAPQSLPPLDAADDEEATQVDVTRPDFGSVEDPKPPEAAPPVAPAGPSRRPLEEVWPEPPRKRELPAKLKIGIGVAVSLVVVIVALGNRGAPSLPDVAVSIDDQMVVSADDLKDRREVRADDFRPKRQFLEVAPRAQAPQPVDPVGLDLAARRARRAADPEDVLTARKSRGSASSEGRRASGADEPYFDGPVYVGAASDDATSLPRDGKSRALLAAGSVVSAVLVTPVELRGDTATVVVKVEKPSGLPPGARFVGTASVSGSRVTMRFRSLLLPGGEQLRIEAEAQDEQGAFGIATNVKEPEDDRGPSVAAIAKDAAGDVLMDAIGGNLAGGVARDVLRSSRDRHSRDRESVVIAAGTPVSIFVHETIGRPE